MSIQQKIEDVKDAVVEKAKVTKNSVVGAAGVVGAKGKSLAGKAKDKAKDATVAVGEKIEKAGAKIADQAD